MQALLGEDAALPTGSEGGLAATVAAVSLAMGVPAGSHADEAAVD
jgi:hypothetical protein